MDGGNGSMIGGTYAKRKAAGADGNVVLNLASVPLQQAAKTVLGDMIGVNYVVDPRVDGVISVQTTHPVSKAEALEMFQTALAPIGAVLVQSPRHLPDCAGRSGRHRRDCDRRRSGR